MAEKKQKRETFVTPKGEAQWPHLRKPDDRPIKGKPQEPAFKVNMRFAKDDPAWLKLKKLLDDKVEEAYQTAIEENPKKKKIITRAYPYSEVLDEEGEETGVIEVKFKQRAVIKRKGKDDINVRIALFDAKGKPLPDGVNPWSGSIVKVSFSPRPYLMDSTNAAGISLSFDAVQVIKLEQGGGANRSANSYGFGEEEGYEADDETAESKSHGFDDEGGEGTEDGDENDEF